MGDKTIIYIAVIMAGTMLVAIILDFVKKVKKEKKENEIALVMYEELKEQQKVKEKMIQEELDLKKRKYKRIKCPYCSSLNKLEAVACINCGGVLENRSDTVK